MGRKSARARELKRIGYEPRIPYGVLYTPSASAAGLDRPASTKPAAGSRRGIFPAIGHALAWPFATLALLFRSRKTDYDTAIGALPVYRPGMKIKPMSKADSRVADLVLAPPGQTITRGSSQPAGRFTFRSWQGVAVLAAGLIVLAGAAMGAFLLLNKSAYVIIDDNGVRSQYKTYAKTVQSLLDAAKVAVGADDELAPSMAAPVTDGLEVSIRRAFTVTVACDDKPLKLTMTHGTVADAIARAGIQLSDTDLVEPSLEAELQPGMTISHFSVTVQEKTVTAAIAYKTITKNDPFTPTGKTKVQQNGSAGTKTITYIQYFRNGEMIKEEAASTKVTKKPVDKVVLKGTGHSKALVILADARKKGPPKESDIKAKKVATYCTAYTHSGHLTSRGDRPGPGIVAADPKQIPYGTKLYIPGYGYGIMRDTGSMRHRPDELDIDLFMNTVSECNKWGRKRQFTFYILDPSVDIGTVTGR